MSFVYSDYKSDEGSCFKYRVSKVLGTGSFSHVKLAVHKETEERFAMKIIDKKRSLQSNKNYVDEVKILHKINHPNVLKLHDAFETDSSLYLVLELVTGGDLLDRILNSKKISEEHARIYFKQLLKAVKYLHDNGIVHRDIKPENVLLKNKKTKVIKLSDFGLAVEFEPNTLLKNSCGTPQYAAPEILNPLSKGHNKCCDLWSLGVNLFILLSGTLPWDESTGSISKQILSASYSFKAKSWNNISPEAKDLISKLLVVDVTKRMTVDEALQSPWIQNK
eukprot:TRINITY_DN3980_c0_g1_i2.p1 TRINITY_DN3980_c0_g1~~TRINITY_DN3980_c0_g1_i2.p1  ORF type:complete len:278 (-),score=55.88 TRINITY_DN3980_c0_g1_i2:15-848(-)